jgi:hypothetical protein
MLFLKFVFSITIYTLMISPLHAQSRQPLVNFKVNVLQLMEGDIHYSSEILSRKDLIQHQPDFREFDSLGLLKQKEAQFLVSKAAFVVRKPIGFFDHQHMTDESFIKHITDGSVKKSDEETFKVTSAGINYRLRNYFDSDDISTLARGRIIHSVAAAKKMDIMVQGAASTVIQEMDQFNTGSDGVVVLLAHLPLKENQTLIISYRLSSIKGLVQEKRIHENLLEELKRLQKNISTFGSKKSINSR